MNSIMKRLTAVLLVLITVICFTACGTTGGETDKSAQTETQTEAKKNGETDGNTENTDEETEIADDNADAVVDDSVSKLAGTWCENGVVYHKLTIDEKGKFVLDIYNNKKLNRADEGVIVLTSDNGDFYAVGSEHSYKITLQDDGTIAFAGKYVLEKLD